MKQKDIYLANLNPSMGNEQSGIRPILIISGNAMNDNFGVVIACPLSSKIKNFAGCFVLSPDDLNMLSEKSEVLTFQVRSIVKERIMKKIGEISEYQFQAIKKGLNEILTY